ncbi:MAG: DnaJ domain-containing protein [Myxococcales bacterium]|nr:DnaJ domain-containing protein [Myxococcales bacterium]
MAVRRLDDLDYYALLKVSRDASADAIKRAFHAFARKYHPDRVAHDPKLSERHTRIYQRGTEAYRVLAHPQQRSLYDRGLVDGVLRFDPECVGAGRGAGATRHKGGMSRTARPFALRARQAMHGGDYRSARLHLKVALGHDPEDPELLKMLLEVESQLG